MALPQPDVEGILSRRGYLAVVGWGRLRLGVKVEQTLSPLRLQPSSQLPHSCVLLIPFSTVYHYYFSFCVHLLFANIQLLPWATSEANDGNGLLNVGAVVLTLKLQVVFRLMAPQ